MKKTIKILIALIVVVGLMACRFTPEVNLDRLQDLVNPTPTPETLQIPTPVPPIVVNGEDIRATDLILTNLYERVNPGVVSIINYTSAGEGSGSGFVYDYEGHVITNYHVVEGATQIEVDFNNGFKTRAEVIGTDLDSDIAVLRVQELPEDIIPLSFGNSDEDGRRRTGRGRFFRYRRNPGKCSCLKHVRRIFPL